jgi:copper(I)-binding protein
MVPMDSVDVPAGGTVEFAPGGRHLMLWTVDPGAASTGKITLKLYFSNGETLLVDAAVEKTGQAPVHHEGDHH